MNAGCDLRQRVSRSRFEDLCGAPMWAAATAAVEACLAKAGVASGKDVDHLFLAGGAARVPKLSKTLSSLVRACSLGSPPVIFCFLCF